jgi:hypothetical protein
MKIKFALIVLISVFTLCIKNVKAQSDPPPKVAHLQPAANFTPAQLKAAERLFDVSGIMDNMHKTFAAIIQTQAQQVPEDKRAAYISVMQNFFAKYFTDDAIKQTFVPIYAAAYTETELNQIADFLSSPAGQAMTAKQSELSNQGMLWGQQVANAHKDELETMMKDAMGEK